jgi:L-ascorbate metabolism protein UlaG (beta-lactamase superfamily)
VLLALAAALVRAGSAPPAKGRLAITALANAGVMLSDGRSAVLIDALFRDGIAGYARLEEGERGRLEKALSPYDAVRLILVTHWHADHFEAGAVTAHLGNNRNARAVVAAQVAAKMPGVRNVEVATPDRGRIDRSEVNGLPVLVVRLAHNPSRNFPEEHVGQAVRLAGRLVLHVGDADPTAANFRSAEPLAPVDVAIVPYWYLLSETGRAIVRDQLRARHVIAVHVEPDKSARIEADVTKAWPGAKVFKRQGDRAEF